MTDLLNASDRAAADVSALLRARNCLIWVVTREEARAERHLMNAAAGAGFVPRTWDNAEGVCDLAGAQDRSVDGEALEDLADVLKVINQRAGVSRGERGVWILRDAPIWLDGLIGAKPLRQLCNLAKSLPRVPRESAQAVMVITPRATIPEELQGRVSVIEWPLPDREEIASILDAAIGNLPEEMQESAAPNGQRDAAIDAAVGLNGEEAASCYARSLVKLRRIDPSVVAAEKRRVIARERVLEWYDPLPGGLDAVGGLDNLKAWLAKRADAYTPAARAYGLPAPKGVLLVGVPGCGKSLTAKAIATSWNVPLLRLDLGALRDKFVGGSEANIRRAFKVIEAVGRCVVWLDEIEKSLPTGDQVSDGGASSDALFSILTWMQERKSDAFVVATANDVSKLPPELLRKGRFDDTFFIDLPTPVERESVLRAALRSLDRDPAAIDIASVAEACPEYSGAEIAALVPEAMFAAYGDSARPITTEDLIAAARDVVPMSKSAAEKIAKPRDWAKTNARLASAIVTVQATLNRGPVLDL